MNLISVLIFVQSIFCAVSVKYRLPTNVRPSFYSLKFQPDLDKEIFYGQVSIHVKVENYVESIALHSSDLTVTNFHLNSKKLFERQDSTDNETAYAYQFSDHQILEVVRLDKSLIAPGNYLLHIEYNGNFSQTGTGFFTAKFTKNGTVVSYLAVTDFEPTHARRVFPCFDEPSFKAKFQLTLVTPNNSYIALSNMKATKTFQTSYGAVYKFETTKVMSTYLLAFAVTQYSYGEHTGRGGVLIRAYSHKITDEDCKKNLEYADQALQFYTEYTGFANLLSKVDFIEYDRNESTATENWGLVTVKSGVLSNGGPYSTEQVINIVVHEIAHFWFGNLVTNAWWDDIWLQEGFAVYMALKAEAHIAKNNATKRFAKDYVEDSVYWADQNEPSQSVVNPAETPVEIRKNFNDMTYVKGAAILQMIELVLGETRFQNAIQCYVCKYAFKTATTDDLIEVFEEFAPFDVDFRSFVDSYLYQNRYPIIEVTEDENNFILKQVNCGYKMNDSETPLGHKWTIPVTIISNLKEDQVNRSIIWFNRDMEQLEIPKSSKSWIKLNPMQKSLYRANYSEGIWEKFISYGHEMDMDERDDLFSEAINLYQADIISCDVALNYIKGLVDSNVTQPVKSDSLVVALFRMDDLIEYDEQAHKMVKNFFRKIVKRQKKSIRSKRSIQDFTETASTPSSEKLEKCRQWIEDNLSNDTALISPN